MPGVPRPIKPSYPVILAELERSAVDQLALEFEAPGLDLELLELCPSKTVPFGCVDNANDSVESPERVADRLLQATRHHDPEKLQAAPDCGLVPLQPRASAGQAELFGRRGPPRPRAALTIASLVLQCPLRYRSTTVKEGNLLFSLFREMTAESPPLSRARRDFRTHAARSSRVPALAGVTVIPVIRECGATTQTP